MLALFTFLYTTFVYAQSGPSNINIGGVLFDSAGTAITSPSVSFKIELYDKTGNCLIYTEDHLAIDLSQTKGAFSIDIGSGSSIQNLIDSTSPAAISSKVYENNGVIAGGWAGCPSGATLADGDSRVIRIKYNLGGGYVTMNPDVPMAAAAYATVAQTLQGKRPADFIQVHNDASNKLTQANAENVFSSTNYPKLTALLAGSSTDYISSSPSAAVGFNSQRITNLADPTAAQDAATKNYVDTNLGGKSVDVSGVGPATGDGYTLIWDQATQTWTTGSPSATDNTKLPLAGGTMTGAITMGGFDILATGHITMSPLKTLTLGTFTTAQETTLVGTLTAANAGASWYNSTTKTFKIWDGTAAISQTFSGAAAGGDLTGTYPNPTIANDKITSAKVDSAGVGLNRLVISDQTTGATLKFATCSTNEVLRYEGVNGWTCRDPSSIVTFPVDSVNGKTGTVVLNANDLGLGTAALENVGTAAGDIPQLDAGGKIPSSMIPAASSPTWGDITNGAGKYMTYKPNNTACGNNELLKFDGTNWVCTSASALGTGDFMKDGSVAMTGNLRLGTNWLSNDGDSEGISINTSGLVGVGMAAGTATLSIKTNGFQGLMLTNTTADATNKGAYIVGARKTNANVPFAMMGSWDDGNIRGIHFGGNGWGLPDPTYMKFITASTYNETAGAGVERMNISSSGNVSIGNGSTFGVSRLDVNGNMTLGSYAGVTAAPSNGMIVSGNVGIGTNAPARLLHVNGAARFTPTTTPSTPAAGDFFLDSAASNALKYYNGSAWQTVGTGTGSGDFMKDGSVAMTGNFNAGGNSILGNTTASANLTLESTSNATKGFVNIQPNGGFVGIGTTTPASVFTVKDTTTSTSAYNSHNVTLTINPSAASTALYRGTYSTAYYSGASNLTGSGALIGGEYAAGHSSNATIAAATGLAGTAVNFWSGTMTAGQGIGGAVTNTSTGSIGTATAGNFTVANTGSGSIGTGYGVYIGSIAATNKWSLYSYDATAPSYFAGSVGIGTNNPGRALHVTGPIRIAPAALPGTPAAGDLAFDSGASNALKFYNGSAWQTVGTGTGSGDFMKDGSVAMTGNFNAGGNSVLGNTTASANLTLESTSNATKGYVNIQPNGGNVGIGTTAPSAPLSVSASNNTWSSQLEVVNTNTGNSATASIKAQNNAGNYIAMSMDGSGTPGGELGQISSTTNIGLGTDDGVATGGTHSITLAAGGYAVAPALTVTAGNPGNVGIGTTSPARPLHVNGAARLTPTTTPSSPAAGDFFFDSAASNALKFYNGSAWQTVGTGSGSGDFLKDGSVAMTGNFNAGGNKILGNTTASANLTLESTSNATKGVVVIQPNGGNVAIGTTAGSDNFEVYNTANSSAGITISTPGTGSAQNSAFTLITKAASGSDYLGTATSKGWIINARADAYGTATDKNKMIWGYWNGSTWINPFAVDTTGNVGIGTTAPGWKLDVRETRTDTAATYPASAIVAQTVGPASASSAGFTSFLSSSTSSGSSNIAAISGSTSQAVHATAASITTRAGGAFNQVWNSGGGSIATAYGSTGEVYANSSGSTITTAYGNQFQVGVNSGGGTITNAAGVSGSVYNSNTTTMTNAYGASVSIANTSTGTITNAYGLSSALTNSGGGTVSNYYGLYLADPGSSSYYGVYSAGSAKSYFGGNVGAGTTSPSSPLDANQATAGSANIQAQKAGTYYWKVATPTNAINTAWNAASAVEYVGKDNTTGRSINAAGTVNATGADFAEWVDWSGAKPEMGSIIIYKGSYVVVSSPFTAAFIGNDVKDPNHAILIAFAGQLPVLVRGAVREGDLIVANGDGTGRAIPRHQVTLDSAVNAVGTAWQSSDDEGVKRVNVAVGIGLGGHGGRDVTALRAEIAELKAKDAAKDQQINKLEKELKARMDRLEQLLKK